MRRRHSTVGDSGSSPVIENVIGSSSWYSRPLGKRRAPANRRDITNVVVARDDVLASPRGAAARGSRISTASRGAISGGPSGGSASSSACGVRTGSSQRARATGVDGQRDGLGRGPEPRPVARRQREAQRGARRAPRRRPTSSRCARRTARRPGRRAACSWSVGMAQVQHAAGDDRRRAVRGDVAQPGGDERRAAGRRATRSVDDRLPQHLEALRDRRGVEASASARRRGAGRPGCRPGCRRRTRRPRRARPSAGCVWTQRGVARRLAR